MIGVGWGIKKLASRGSSRDRVLSKFGFSLDDLRAAGTIVDRGPYTKAGRALTKHGEGQRASGTFPALKGSPEKINLQGQDILYQILDHPKASFKPLGRGGLEVRLPDGGGVRFDADGSLSGFVD